MGALAVPISKGNKNIKDKKHVGMILRTVEATA
jgi:hypothetical protein